MATVFTSVEQFIGNTPLLELKNIEKTEALQAKILAKLEMLNPAGSVKDRVAKAMLDDAEEKGLLDKNTVIIEPTSGNTGIGLCALASMRGYSCKIVMPDTMSVERRRMMTAYGAEVILSPGAQGMAGAIAMAEQLAKEIPNSFIPGQFDNPANPHIHEITTGPEIFRDTDGAVDIFIAGVGTGGTITGVGRFLKEQNSNIHIVAVEPANSAVLSGKKAGSHGLQGIGAGFIPKVLDSCIIDEILCVTEAQAYTMARRMGKEEGLSVGISSGAALYGAVKLAKRPENAGKTIVTLLPDSGQRYLSTDLFE